MELELGAGDREEEDDMAILGQCSALRLRYVYEQDSADDRLKSKNKTMKLDS